ncbi:flavin reductase family protein [Streptomyces sp. NPDC049577]|uniref:flavin reductase family protein n=1 Tax=Streptomyces sp. NPDC049577 TaxID=3155153 RepID=UPI00342BBE6E
MTTAVDEAVLRDAASTFCTGVAVVTAVDGTSAVGLTVQSFVSLSLDPPYVTFCPSRTSASWPRIRAAGRLAVNVLAWDQGELGRRFASRGTDRFAGVDWRPGANGAPLLAGALTCFEADVDREFPGGDHVIVVARVTRAERLREAAPLLYFRRTYHGLAAARD